MIEREWCRTDHSVSYILTRHDRMAGQLRSQLRSQPGPEKLGQDRMNCDKQTHSGSCSPTWENWHQGAYSTTRVSFSRGPLLCTRPSSCSFVSACMTRLLSLGSANLHDSHAQGMFLAPLDPSIHLRWPHLGYAVTLQALGLRQAPMLPVTLQHGLSRLWD